jgi:hypothetical protein
LPICETPRDPGTDNEKISSPGKKLKNKEYRRELARLFDRSWYNRAGVERVMGFCTEEQARWFLKAAPVVEKMVPEKY